MKTNNRELRDWFIITVIILIGFLCLIVAGSMAVRFSPSWELDASMDSLLDPNSDFLTRRPLGFIEPVDESILTPPIWIGLFQTPGALVPQRTPLPPITSAPGYTSTSAAVSTSPAIPTLIPTNTVIYHIPASPTNTSRPQPQPTATLPVATVPATTVPPTVPITVDLQITKDDGVLMYASGTTLTYTIIVTNNGPANVTGAVVTDTIPAQFDNWIWICTLLTGGATGCDPSANKKVDFSDTVDLPNGASIQYTVTANISATASGDLVNTASVSLPAPYLDSNTSNNSATDTDVPSIDLQITKTDGGINTYTAGGSSTYTVSVTNNSTFDLTGITVSDNIPSLVTTWGWCAAPCTPLANTNMDLGATIDLTAGSSVTYNILAMIHPFATGNLTNTASVYAPLGYTDAAPGNNTATDTNINQTGEPEEGPPDGNVYNIPNGGQAVFYLSQAITADGGSNADFVFYEFRADIGGGVQGILLDQIIIEISQDGTNWFRVFYWGDGGGDTNTNVATVAACPTEMDNCPIPLTDLYNGNSAGITVDVDNSPLDSVPSGNYHWIRFTEPSGVGDGAHIDSIEILP